MERTFTLKTLETTDNVGLYSICINSDNESEFEKFIRAFKDNAQVRKDYQFILLAIQKICTDGALERLFRPEGRMNDGLVALSIDSRKLRLYCVRISDRVLILGNGGIKTTRTYEQDELLNSYVMDLQTFERLLVLARKSGTITIERTVIKSIETETITLKTPPS